MMSNLDIRDLYVDIRKNVYSQLYAKEGEVNSRGLRVYLLNNGSIMNAEGMSLYLYAKTKSGDVYRVKATALAQSEGIFQIVYPSNMLQYGEIEAELRLEKDDGSYNIATKTFVIDIEKKILSDEMIDGSNDPSFLETLIEILNKIENGELKGEPGKDGKDGTVSFDELTPEQKEQLRGEPGKDGKDGEDGEDVTKENIENALGYTPASQDDLDELFTSVSNGKALIAAAITDMGIETSSSDTFDAMSNNIKRIESEGGTVGLDTSLIRSTHGMFKGSEESSIDLSFFNTSNVRDMAHMFENSNANEIDLTSFDTNNVEDMSYMFTHSSANNINMSSFDTSKVKNMRNMFWGSNVSELNLSNFDTSNVENMAAMFSELNNVSELDLSNFDTSNVESMNAMFYGLTLNSLDVSNFNTELTGDFYSMFNNSSIDNLDISGFDMSESYSSNSMFKNFTGDNLSLPEYISIGGEMFSGASVDIVDLSKKAVEYSGLWEAFKGFTGQKVDISSLDTSETFLWSLESIFEDSEIDTLVIGSSDFEHVEITSNMFRNAKIGTTDLSNLHPMNMLLWGESENMFEGFECNNLILPEDFRWMDRFNNFMKNAKLDEINIKCGDIDEAYSMFEGFEGDKVTLSFDYCSGEIDDIFKNSNVNIIDMGEVTMDNTTYIPDGILEGCTANIIYVGDEDLKDALEDSGVNPLGIPVEVKQ